MAKQSLLALLLVSATVPVQAQTAIYDEGVVILIEGLAATETRTLTLSGTPNSNATAAFTLTGGVANGSSVTNTDITLTVGGGADMLSLDANGGGGTFRIPAGNTIVTITFATPADTDTVAEFITFSITGIDFQTGNDIGALFPLAITVGEGLCNRTSEVLMGIRNAIDSDSPPDCAAITLAQLRGITALDLDLGDTPHFLRSDDFAGLSMLGSLDLSDNSLRSLPVNVFNGLPSLTSLELFENSFVPISTLLPVGVFNNILDTVTHLNIGMDFRVTASLGASESSIAPGSTHTLTVQLINNPRFFASFSSMGALPVTMRFDLTTTGVAGGSITLPDPATVTIPAGATSASFNITLAAETAAGDAGAVAISDPVVIYADIRGTEQQNTAVAAGRGGLVNTLESGTAVYEFSVGDLPEGVINICGRTPAVETAILSAVSGAGCLTITEVQLSSITRLVISRAQGEDSLIGLRLMDGDFANLSGLENLIMDRIALLALSEDLFDGLSMLQNLQLNFNRLQMLPVNVFDGLSMLQNLQLDFNSLQSLPVNVFDSLSRLETLDLRRNSQLSLPAGIFDGVLDTLTTLELDPRQRATVSIEPSGASIAPGSTDTLTAQLTSALPATVSFTLTAGRRISSITFPDSDTVTIPAGATSASFNIALAAGASAEITDNVKLSNPALLYPDAQGMVQKNTAVAGALVRVNRLNVPVSDIASLRADPSSITEDATSGNSTVVTLELATSAQSSISIPYTINPDPDTDITTASTGTFNFSTTDTMATVTITARDDEDPESPEEFTLSLTPGIYGDILVFVNDPNSSVTITILDDDSDRTGVRVRVRVFLEGPLR